MYKIIYRKIGSSYIAVDQASYRDVAENMAKFLETQVDFILVVDELDIIFQYKLRK